MALTSLLNDVSGDVLLSDEEGGAGEEEGEGEREEVQGDERLLTL